MTHLSKILSARLNQPETYDAETSKPKIQSSTKPKTPPKKEGHDKDNPVTKKTVALEPTKSEFQTLLTPYLRFPLLEPRRRNSFHSHLTCTTLYILWTMLLERMATLKYNKMHEILSFHDSTLE